MRPINPQPPFNPLNNMKFRIFRPFQHLCTTLTSNFLLQTNSVTWFTSNRVKRYLVYNNRTTKTRDSDAQSFFYRDAMQQNTRLAPLISNSMLKISSQLKITAHRSTFPDTLFGICRCHNQFNLYWITIQFVFIHFCAEKSVIKQFRDTDRRNGDPKNLNLVSCLPEPPTHFTNPKI